MAVVATDHRQGAALLGRRDDLARLDELAAGARAQRGGAITIVGAPGVGKTALLSAVRPAGVRVIDVTAAESEVALPWTGLASLVEPLLDHDASLTPTARGALRGALALGQPTTVADSARVLHSAVGLLAAAAEHEPLLLRVDDVQWLDPSSRQAIAFIVRRAADIGIAAIAVWSERGEPFEPWPGVPVLTIEELGRADALALARRAGVAPAVAEALVDAVGGNPLGLIEAPAQLSTEERDGRKPLPAALPVGARLETAFASRLDALPSATREALLVAALSADGATAPLRAALGSLDVLAPAEDAGMIVVDARGLAFAHPIVRTAVERAADAERAPHRSSRSCGRGQRPAAGVAPRCGRPGARRGSGRGPRDPRLRRRTARRAGHRGDGAGARRRAEPRARARDRTHGGRGGDGDHGRQPRPRHGATRPGPRRRERTGAAGGRAAPARHGDPAGWKSNGRLRAARGGGGAGGGT